MGQDLTSFLETPLYKEIRDVKSFSGISCEVQKKCEKRKRKTKFFCFSHI